MSMESEHVRGTRLREVYTRPAFFRAWEKLRKERNVRWAVECMAEMLGCFLYTYMGIGCSMNKIIAVINNEPSATFNLQIGIAISFGIIFAIGVCGGASAGHYNPGFTVMHVIFKRFPILKALCYIVAQILGGYIASMVVYYQYKFLIDQMTDILTQRGQSELIFTALGPSGMFGLQLTPGQSLGGAFLSEWFASMSGGLVYWASMDPTNKAISPTMSAILTAFAYGVSTVAFGASSAALNSARDVGGRLWAITVWGLPASGGRYAAIAALTNIPATFSAIIFYELICVDSDKVVTCEAWVRMQLSNLERSEIRKEEKLGIRKEEKLESPMSRLSEKLSD